MKTLPGAESLERYIGIIHCSALSVNGDVSFCAQLYISR